MRIFPAPTLSLVLLAGGTAAMAQQPADEISPDGIDEIVVTAEKRDRNLQDLPSSISVVSNEDLDLLAGRSLADAATLAPNVIVQNQGGRSSTYFYARGIGRSELNFPIVSVNVNGVALPDPSFFGLDLDAAAQVEFLRGPHGTLYGQNTLGGVINITLKQPAGQFAGSADTLIGARGYREAAMRLEGPVLGNRVRAAGTLFWNDVDGYIDNPTTDRDQNPERTLGASLYLAAEPSDALRVEVSYFGQDRADGLPQYAQGSKLFEITNDAPTEEDVRSDVIGVRVGYDFGPVLLESQSGFVATDRFTQNDLDFSPFPFASATAASDITQWSQELRLLSQDNGVVDYMVGAYGSGLDNEFDVFINDFADFSGLGLPAQINDRIAFEDLTLAAFGQVNWRIGAWELTAGLRYQYQEIETDNTNTIRALPADPALPPLFPATSVDGGRDFNELLPRLAATYAASDGLKLYASVSRGFRAGGFNNTALTAQRLGINLPVSFGPEFTWNYEVGAKWRLPKGMGRIDAAVFLIDWQDLQAEQIAPGTLIDFRTNAASATSVGAEIEARLYPGDDWELGATLGYANAEYDDFQEALTGASLTGNQIAGGAETTWSVFARYARAAVIGPLGIAANVSVNGVSGRFFDTANNVPGDDYALLNVRFGFTYENLEVFAFVRNALDERYIEFEFPGFGRAINEPRLYGAGMEIAW